VILAWLGIATALGQSRAAEQDRARVQLALIAEAVRGDIPTAIARYQHVVRTQPVDHPLWALAVVAWARGLYEDGRVAEAEEALREAIRRGRCEADCLSLLQTIGLDQESIRETPVDWTFRDENPGLFHHWSRQGQGELVATPRGLSWTTQADPRRSDRLVMGFIRPEPPPAQLEFIVRSIEATAFVRIVLEDESGDRFVTPTTRLPPNEATPVVALVEEVVAEDPTSRLDPGRLSRVSLEDLTGSRRSGPHTLQFVRFRAE